MILWWISVVQIESRPPEEIPFKSNANKYRALKLWIKTYPEINILFINIVEEKLKKWFN